MAKTTFSGPVASLNGFIGGTATDPIVVTTAQNINSSFATTTAATGDTRLAYDKLTFAAAGAGETLRAFSVVTGDQGAGQTTNGAHISAEINSGGSISGAANALRATLGGTEAAPGGTLSVLQLDTNYTVDATLPATSSFIRVSDSGTATGEVNTLVNIEAGPAATLTATVAGTPVFSGTNKSIKIMIGGVVYYLVASTAITV
jgi:hypothetical protein